MAAAETFSYESNFGADIRDKVAAVRAAMTSAKAPQPVPTNIVPKYQNWFSGGAGAEDTPQPKQDSRLKRIVPGMALKELAAATRNNMAVLGNDSYDEFEKRMRRMMPGHRMVRSIKASILTDKPHFGSCRIGKVPLKRDVTSEIVTVTELQFYIANFDTVLNTAEGAAFHTPQSKEFGRTFFGVVIDINETTGEAIGFNKAYGQEGVVFQTDKPKDALTFMTAFSSGKRPAEIAEMFEKATQQAGRSAPAPAPAGMCR